MNEVVSSRSLDTPAHRSARWPKILALVVLVIGGLAGLVYHELRTSAIQSWLLSRYAARLSYEIKQGPSPSIAFPGADPSIRSEAIRGSAISDAGSSPPGTPWPSRRVKARAWCASSGGASPHVSRARGGGTGHPRLPGRVDLRRAAGRRAVPQLRGGPAPDRQHAALPGESRADQSHRPREQSRHRLGPAGKGQRTLRRPRGRTARAIRRREHAGRPAEKYRHSESGRTASPLDKLRQLTAASLRAYRDGPDSTASRQEIVLDYLNTMPLAAAPGYGEVHGLGNGLRAWFDLDLDGVESALELARLGPRQGGGVQARTGSPLRRPRPHPLPGGGSGPPRQEDHRLRRSAAQGRSDRS